MTRRRLVVVAMVVVALALLAALVVSRSRGSGGGAREGAAAAGGVAARDGRLASSSSGVGLSWRSQRGAPARRVAGRVTFEGRPVDGATVRLARPGSRATLATQATGADGRFDFGALDATPFVVAASADGKAGVLQPVDLRNPALRPPPDQLVLELRPCAAALVGFLLDASSGPIPGARVRRGPLEAVAGDDGAYTLCVPIGDVRVEVGADGYGTIALELAVTNRTRRDFRLSPEGVVTGRAVRADDGRPVADAVVTVRPAASEGRAALLAMRGGVVAEVVTDADGRFRVDGLVPGRSRVSAVADGMRAPDVDVNVIAGESGEELVVALEPAVAVQGRVVDEVGAGVVGAVVTLSEGQGLRGRRDGSGPSAVSQDDGSFVLSGLLPATYAIDVAPFPETEKTRSSVEVTPAGVKELTLVVARGSTVSGVVTRSGKPVGDARVYLQSGARMQAITEADGRFTLRGVAPGEHEIYAESSQEGAFDRGAPVTVREGVDVTGLTIELSLAGSIAGVVVDQQGTPVSGAYLSFQLGDGRDFGESTTAVDGTFEARSLSGGGEYRVAIMASRGSSLRFLPVEGDDFPRVAVAGGDAHVTGVRYAVTIDRLSISGKVVDEKARPLADVRVEASPRGDSGWEMGEVPAAVSDGDGAFTITNLLAGDYVLDARAGTGAEARTNRPVAAGERNVELVLSTPGQIEGTLVGFARSPRITARPMTERAMMRDDALRGAVTGDGFRVRGVPPGRYTVAAHHGGVAADSALVEVKAGETARVTLTNKGTGAVKGTAMDASGAPVRGARCTVMAEAGVDHAALVDEHGAFAITPAPVGQLAIACFHFVEGARSSGLGAVTVEADQTATVAITMTAREAPRPRATIGATWVESPAGLRVASLVVGGPAEKAGLKLRDLLVEIEHLGAGYRDMDAARLGRIISRQEPGATFTFRLKRDNETVSLPVTFAAVE